MKTNPNQKIVQIKKAKTDKDNHYMITNLEALQQAAINLKAGAFKLWIYFSKNQNGYNFALSNKDANDSFGIKRDQYDNAVKELIEKGYLYQSDKNIWTFTEFPL